MESDARGNGLDDVGKGIEDSVHRPRPSRAAAVMAHNRMLIQAMKK